MESSRVRGREAFEMPQERPLEAVAIPGSSRETNNLSWLSAPRLCVTQSSSLSSPSLWSTSILR